MAIKEKTAKVNPGFFGKVLMILLCIICSYICLFFISNSNKGLDLTDESHYLISAIQPENVLAPQIPSHFGFYTSFYGNFLERA